MNLPLDPRLLRRILFGLALLITAILGATWFIAHAKETWQPPRHQNLEVYLTRHNQFGRVGSTGHPNLSTVTADSHSKFKFSTMEPNATTPYEVELEYLGREGKGDRYLVQYSSPISQRSTQQTTRTITYDGRDLELFRDNDYVIGLRPGAAPERTKLP